MSEIEKPATFKYCVAVKFIGSKKSYNFGTNDDTLKYGDCVVVETIRGTELGELISDLRDVSEHGLSISLKPISRKATERDIRDNARNKEEAPKLMEKCQKCISELNLDMNLISAEYTLDRTKIIFSYVADERVDFRELLKSLASAFKCRIELRQIGPRDKAKIIGGLGCCGMETCCSRFMEDFDIVSINMAKNQLLALNTAKLSGQCGKLMCCLKYEDEVYKELREGMPKMNALVYYEGEKYRITSMNILNNTARISNRDSAVDLSINDLKVLMENKEPEPQEAESTPKAEPQERTKPVQENKPKNNRPPQENRQKQQNNQKRENKQEQDNSNPQQNRNNNKHKFNHNKNRQKQQNNQKKEQ